MNTEILHRLTPDQIIQRAERRDVERGAFGLLCFVCGVCIGIAAMVTLWACVVAR